MRKESINAPELFNPNLLEYQNKLIKPVDASMEHTWRVFAVDKKKGTLKIMKENQTIENPRPGIPDGAQLALTKEQLKNWEIIS